MFVWSKRLVVTLLGLFLLTLGGLLLTAVPDSANGLTISTTHWMALNGVGLSIWVFVWMIDQARMRGKNVWLWFVPFVLAPLPTTMLFIVFLQRRIQPPSRG
ncbi:MAG: hypothetical protein JW388_0530 [Nitrospira sp.]|nr:hypothetical protein [Nitrospira sp.]